MDAFREANKNEIPIELRKGYLEEQVSQAGVELVKKLYQKQIEEKESKINSKYRHRDGFRSRTIVTVDGKFKITRAIYKITT